MLLAAQMAQMSRLLDEALELDPAGRRSWLEALSAEYRDLEPALRRALLPEADGASGSEELVTLPDVGAGVQTDAVGSGLQAGERVGPYLLVRPLGAGGMAEVWLAQRADGAFKREVALKLPMLSRLRKDLASRFARECDILAALEHPNIARLYDAGASAEGLPYLAMEYVRGEPLSGWCNAHRLGIRERLKLFLQVLDAVQYAHGRQVIHRDIKPSNILVTESGQVRLLDFGVAKLLAHDEQTELTQIYGRALTPEYASPELVRGDPIDAAADVYSLGVVLYELLSGSRPYRLKSGASMLQLEQAIATAQVQRPSTQVGKDAGADRSTTQDKLARRLRGDLDAIVLKALAKAPQDRYGSAAALADDLQRYLDAKPVQARPANPAYLIGKFVLRHRIGVATTTAVAVLVAAGVGYEVMRSPRVEQPAAPNATVAAASTATTTVGDKSIAVLPFVDMSEKHDQEYFSDGLTEELIDRLSHSPDLKVIARTSAFQFKGKNEDMRSIAGKLGVANLLEGSVRKAGDELRITAQLVRASDGIYIWSQTYERRLDDIFKIQEDLANTVATALKAVMPVGPRSQNARTNPEAYSLLLQGEFFHSRHSRESQELATSFYRRSVALDPNYALAWAMLGRSIMMRSCVWGPVPGARAQALEAAQRALLLDPNLAVAHATLGYVLSCFDGDPAIARAELERAVELDPRDLWTRFHVIFPKALNSGDFGEAIECAKRSVARDPLDTFALGHLSEALYYAGRFEELAEVERKILQLSPDYSGAHAMLGLALALQRRNDEAVKELAKEPEGPDRFSGLAIAYWGMGERIKSDSALSKLTKYESTNMMDIARVYAYRGERDIAMAWLKRMEKKHAGQFDTLKADPLFVKLHDDPEFKQIVLRLGTS